MRHEHDGSQPPDPLDTLVTELLECGAVLSQIVGRMVQFQAAGRSAPDAAPIPEVAHSLIRGVLGRVQQRHSKRDIRMSAAIIAEATRAMGEEIFFLGPDLN